MSCSKVLAAILAVVVVLGSGVTAAAETTTQNSDRSLAATLLQAGDPEEIVCVPDLVAQFDALKHHGESLGFFRGNSPDPTLGRHYQGIQRMPGPGTPYAFLSRNGNPTIGDPLGDAVPGNLVIVRFDSRDTDGERLRSNKLQHGQSMVDTPPPAGDRAVETITFDGNGWPDYRHAGGMQMLGDVIAVPLEKKGPSAVTDGMVVLIDMSDPENPLKLKEIAFDHTAGAVAITRNPANGRILMVIEGPNSNEKLLVFESNVADIHDPNLAFSLIDEWQNTELVGGSWPTGATAHQTINLFQDCGGGLYLLGTRNDSFLSPIGEDHAILYEVELGANGDFGLTQLRDSHLFCESDFGQLCNFAAAGGFYVSPSGELILYGAEHENDGPNGSIRMGEFRNLNTYRLDSPAWAPRADAGPDTPVLEGGSVVLDDGSAQPPIAGAWVELYDDNGFEDRSLVIDYADRFLDDFNNLNEDGFNDKISSVRWVAPAGCQIILWEDNNFGGDQIVLEGTGAVDSISDLDDVDFGDETSAAEFVGQSCDAGNNLTFSWDLNGDGNFETPGETAVFDASNLDGPSTADVAFRACGPFFSSCDTDELTVNIQNASPTLGGTLTESQIDEGGQVTFNGTVTDPSPTDTFTVTIDWGDGTEPDVLNIDANEFQVDHIYADDFPPNTPADDFEVSVTVEDSDGAEDNLTQTVTVQNLDPEVNDVTAEGPGRRLGQVTITVDAADAGGVNDPLTYAFDCDNDGDLETGPQVENSTTCDLGIQEGEFLVGVQVFDDDTGTEFGAVRFSIPTFMCASKHTGLLRYAGEPGCRSYETPVTLNEDGPVTACISSFTDILRFANGRGCQGHETAVVLPEQGPLPVCISEHTGLMRTIGNPNQCQPSEFPRIIGTPRPPI